MERQFLDLCRKGDLKGAKEFLKKCPYINVSVHDEAAFRGACYRRYLEMAQWLLSVKPDINISADNNFAFHYPCVNGHLEFVKWLLSVKPDINIYIWDFNIACERGHLEVAQLLLSVKPDIDISYDNNCVFRYTCHSYLYRADCKYLKVAKWLQTLKPYLYVIEYDDNGNYTGYKIRSKEEAIWERRKHALHLALQEENNLLYHLPIDIAKTVALFL